MKFDCRAGTVAILLSVLVLLTTACSFHFKTDGIAATGKTVEQTIDVKLPSMLHQAAPELPLGHARCPDGLMELDHGQVGHCTFELGAVALPIRVTLDSNGQIQYVMDGFFFDMNRVQPYIESGLLQDFGVSAKIDCGDPRYRVLKAGTRLSCAMSGVPSASMVSVKVLANGGVFVYNPAGLKSMETTLTQPLIKRHKAGQQVIVSEAILEQSFRTLEVLLQQNLARENLKIEGLSCPKAADISGDKRAICILSVSGRKIQVAFWIKNSDWNAETVQVIFPREKLEAAATKYYTELERNNGFNVPVKVHCPWPELLIVTPPTARDCVLLVDKDKRRLTIQILNRSGSFNYYVWPKSTG
jgi:hypothetical protein